MSRTVYTQPDTDPVSSCRHRRHPAECPLCNPTPPLEDVDMTLTVYADMLPGLLTAIAGLQRPACSELGCTARATHEVWTGDRGWLPVCVDDAEACLDDGWLTRQSAIARLQWTVARTLERRRRLVDMGEVYSDTVHPAECTNPACGHCR